MVLDDGSEDKILLEDETCEAIYTKEIILYKKLPTTSGEVAGFPNSADLTTGSITKVFLSNGGNGYKTIAYFINNKFRWY